MEEKYHGLDLAIDINPLFNGLLEEKRIDIKNIDQDHISGVIWILVQETTAITLLLAEGGYGVAI